VIGQLETLYRPLDDARIALASGQGGTRVTTAAEDEAYFVDACGLPRLPPTSGSPTTTCCS